MELNLRVLAQLENRNRQNLIQAGVTPEMIDSGFETARNGIRQAWVEGDVLQILMWLDNTAELAFVCDNHEALLQRGLYEIALVNAYQDTRTNFKAWDPCMIGHLFSIADPVKLRTAGDPMPTKKDTYTLFRGVAGIGKARRVNGMSWTDSLETAKWFANRFSLDDPAVFTVTVPDECVLAYLTGRNESEYLLRLPLPARPKKVA